MSGLARVAVCCIGTEITRGEINNTNATWLSEQLTAAGLDVRAHLSVADDGAAIAAALSQLSAENDLVVCTGGLGPTTDDITSQSVAAWLGVGQVQNAAVLDALARRLANAGRAMTASSAQQANFPDGSTLLDNPHGTAPGFAVSRHGARLFFMPGVPREMRPMFESYVLPAARSLVRGGQHQVRLHCFGVAESLLNDALSGLEAAHGVTVGYRAHFPEVEVKLLASASTLELATARAEAAAIETRARLGSAVYAEGSEDMPAVVGRLLSERGLTLSLAESCTGGLVSALLTRHPASDFLLGGVVAYANHIKTNLLGVDAGVLEALGAVSPEVAAQMAEGARRRFVSDLALSLTGIAGPSGGSEQKPLGLVYYALASDGQTVVRDVNITGRPRENVQLYAAWCGLNLIREHLIANT